MESPVTISSITLPNIVHKHFLVESLFEQIVAEISKIPKLMDFKMTNDATLLVCGIVENAVKSDTKIDKKALVLRILTHVFGLNQTEVDHVSRQIEFIHSGGMLIKAAVEEVATKSNVRKLGKFFLRCVKPKKSKKVQK